MADSKDAHASAPSVKEQAKFEKEQVKIQDGSKAKSEAIQEKASAPVHNAVAEKKDEKTQKSDKAEKTGIVEKTVKAAPVEKKREIVLERIYSVNLRKAYSQPHLLRASGATNDLKQFVAKNMKVPVSNVRIAPQLNDSMHVRGLDKPSKYVKIKATKDKAGLVWAESSA